MLGAWEAAVTLLPTCSKDREMDLQAGDLEMHAAFDLSLEPVTRADDVFVFASDH